MIMSGHVNHHKVLHTLTFGIMASTIFLPDMHTIRQK